MRQIRSVPPGPVPPGRVTSARRRRVRRRLGASQASRRGQLARWGREGTISATAATSRSQGRSGFGAEGNGREPCKGARRAHERPARAGIRLTKSWYRARLAEMVCCRATPFSRECHQAHRLYATQPRRARQTQDPHPAGARSRRLFNEVAGHCRAFRLGAGAMSGRDRREGTAVARRVIAPLFSTSGRRLRPCMLRSRRRRVHLIKATPGAIAHARPLLRLGASAATGA